MWANPNADIRAWSENLDDHVSFSFGPKVLKHFLQKHDLDVIVRSKEVVEDGYEFFADRQLVTIFGAPDFRDEYDNAAAILTVDENLQVSFQVCASALWMDLPLALVPGIYRY